MGVGAPAAALAAWLLEQLGESRCLRASEGKGRLLRGEFSELYCSTPRRLRTSCGHGSSGGWRCPGPCESRLEVADRARVQAGLMKRGVAPIAPRSLKQGVTG